MGFPKINYRIRRCEKRLRGKNSSQNIVGKEQMPIIFC
ncbi:hypothetical protein P872_22605 [Rhodonellum psychrophilum GCM71 = DSM 17998]|uniref:Uncharacterized protein n=1 Tax=Rhodonellum psychrophilum GCM71 = DSM 17998 TaxID=1123057 RepID=U5C4Z4_9BACT|nr:hypothetical protein P872_22605 [Rhodonellum psychrophilum GCM71 = DSM 17998]